MNPGQSQQLKDDVFSDELIDSLPNSSQLDDFGGGANGSETSSICSQASLPFTSRNMACLYIFVSDVKDKVNTGFKLFSRTLQARVLNFI